MAFLAQSSHWRAPVRGEHRCLCLVGEDFRRQPYVFQKSLVHGPKMPGGAADPVVERDALPGVDLRLPIEREVIRVFGNEHVGDGRLGRQAASFSRARTSRQTRRAP
jgi:hypothetical protein